MNMTKHNNPSIAERCLRIFNTKHLDHIGSEIAPVIRPVIPIQPKIDIIKYGNRSTTGNTTIFTTDSDKDFYLTSFSLSCSQDNTADSDGPSITVLIDGVSTTIAKILKRTLTEHHETIFVTLPFPIKVDRGQPCRVSQTFTVGNASCGAILYGYYEEVTR